MQMRQLLMAFLITLHISIVLLLQAMEPKVIKEENGEKDAPAFVETPMRTTRSAKLASKERCKTPDSPEGARLAQGPPLSPAQSSPPPRPVNGGGSPIINGPADSLTPPLPTSAALSVSLEGPHSLQFNHVGGYSSCITRPLVKVKRFLSTLIQFGNDIGPEIGERVRNLVLNLVSSNMSVEDFHHSLQDVTNFPLRPFVMPFLHAHLPILQREIHALARTNKQTALQYLKTHDYVILDPAHSPTEASDIFLSADAATTGFKRKAIESENLTNGQSQQECADYPPPVKRPLNSQNPFLSSHQSLLLPNITSAVPNPHFFDYTHTHAYSAQNRHEEPDTRNSNRGDEEWKNIHVMLNCILSMVEKTKRALTILQQRNNQDLTSDWLRRQDVGVDLKKAANDIMLQAVRQTEDRVAEVKRRAEEAVNDVKRQAVLELQKAVSAAETKANELVSSERAKMEKILADARKHPDENHADGENGQTSNAQPAPSQQNSCWNCGRKAHETCSGCSMARYCGPFCQHKDWENHHLICSKEKLRPLRSNTPSTTASLTNQNEASSAKFKK